MPTNYESPVSLAISPTYLADLFAARDDSGLVWLAGVLCGSDSFDAHDATCGLPEPLFLFVECLNCFAASRSGVWTYFEATPPPRAQAVLMAFAERDPPSGLAELYAATAMGWREPGIAEALDRWLDDHEQLCADYLWNLLAANRDVLESLLL